MKFHAKAFVTPECIWTWKQETMFMSWTCSLKETKSFAKLVKVLLWRFLKLVDKNLPVPDVCPVNIVDRTGLDIEKQTNSILPKIAII